FEAGLADLVNALNNRLGAMVGFAQLLGRRSVAAEDRETVDRVVAEAMSAAQLARDLVRLVRKPAGRQESTSLRTALEKALRRWPAGRRSSAAPGCSSAPTRRGALRSRSRSSRAGCSRTRCACAPARPR